MRKKTFLFVAVSSLLLASCGGSGWSCKKRYCDTVNENLEINKSTQIVVDSEIACR